MSKSERNLTAVFTDTANAIRAKKDSSELISPVDFADEIATIETGITPTGTKNISANGNNIDVYNYAAVNVNVPNPSTGTLDISENGEYDVTSYANVDVNVEGSVTLDSNSIYSTDSEGDIEEKIGDRGDLLFGNDNYQELVDVNEDNMFFLADRTSANSYFTKVDISEFANNTNNSYYCFNGNSIEGYQLQKPLIGVYLADYDGDLTRFEGTSGDVYYYNGYNSDPQFALQENLVPGHIYTYTEYAGSDEQHFYDYNLDTGWYRFYQGSFTDLDMREGYYYYIGNHGSVSQLSNGVYEISSGSASNPLSAGVYTINNNQANSQNLTSGNAYTFNGVSAAQPFTPASGGHLHGTYNYLWGEEWDEAAMGLQSGLCYRYNGYAAGANAFTQVDIPTEDDGFYYFYEGVPIQPGTSPFAVGFYLFDIETPEGYCLPLPQNIGEETNYYTLYFTDGTYGQYTIKRVGGDHQ